ncbi:MULTISPECIES: TetR/AcrR family transcriptional regulator [Pseudomonas]|nr:MULTISPECIES: TetR/AcrR family transcriptional regulator [Pseudomonas]
MIHFCFTYERNAVASRITVPETGSPKGKRSSKPTPASGNDAPAPARKERGRPPGRTRSDAARIAIFNATLKLLETQTVQQITIESIAKEAGVGKATIYRWWPSKASVVIDAFVQNHIVHTPLAKGGSCRETLAKHMHLLVEQYSGWPGQLVAQILAEGQADPDVLREFRERFFYGRRAVVREVIDEGRRCGEFRTDIDPENQMDFLYAPIYFRLLFGHAPLDQVFADKLADTMLKLLSPPAGPEIDLEPPAKPGNVG